MSKTIKILPEKTKVMKFITTVGAPGEVVEKVAGRVLMKLSSGQHEWYEESVLTDISS